MQQHKIDKLISDYLKGDLSDEGLEKLNQWIGLSDNNKLLFEQLTNVTERNHALKEIYEIDKTAGWDKLRLRLLQEYPVARKHVRSSAWLPYAAAIIFVALISCMVFLFLPGAQQTRSTVGIDNSNPGLLPGTNEAVLQLSNGSRIIIDTTRQGKLAQEAQTSIINYGHGQLVYNTASNRSPTENTYNILFTKRSNQYQLTLSDGSKVWLNSASSLRYPTEFSQAERSVELTGEAYFEIMPQKKPFIVRVRDMKVKVLGTHFNIMAYSEEPNINTTLLEGSLSIEQDTNTVLLKPGQQLKFNPVSNVLSLITHANKDEAVAWKNGLFYFDGKNIEQIMREVGRWYNADIVFKSTTNKTFSGTIPKTVKASSLLKMLEATQSVSFKTEGRTIEVIAR